MTTPVQFQANDWLVFLDGVQIPFISLSYTVGRDVVPKGLLQLEPDAILAALRPNAVVSVFFKDTYREPVDASQPAPETEDEYVYFGGGEVTSVTIDKRPNSKTAQLAFTHELGILDQHRAVGFGVGGSFTGVIVTGSTIINPFSGASNQSDLFSIATLGVISDTPIGPQLEEDSFNYSTRLLGAIAWFASGNASLRNRVSQHRLMNKFVSIDNQMTQELIKRKMAPGFNNVVQDKLSSGQSVLEVIMSLNAIPDYRLVSIATPPYLSREVDSRLFKQVHKSVTYPLNKESDPNYANQYYTNSWARHDTVLTPNLYFAAPPPCNIILPDLIQGITYTRTFNSEFTRAVFEDQLSGQAAPRLMFASTDKIPGLATAKSPMEFWASVEQMYESSKEVVTPSATDSPYARLVKTPNLSTGAASETVNLLSSVADSELAKGIITANIPRDSEYLTALTASALIKANANDGKSTTDSAANKLREVLADSKSGTPEDDGVRDYVRYVQSWLDYKHGLSRFNRSADIAVKGHRWLTPGFTGVVFDQDISLIFLVDSVSYTVDSSGDENTSISVSHVRPIQDIPPELVASSTKLTNDVLGLKTKISDSVKSVYNAERSQVDKILANIVSESSRLKTQFAASAVRNDLFDYAKTVAGQLLSLKPSAIPLPTVTTDAAAFLTYLGSVATLVALGEQVFGKSLGPNRNTAGAVAMQRYPDLATEWLKLAAGPTSVSSFQDVSALINELTAFCNKLGGLINQTLSAQEQQALNNEPAFASTQVGETDLAKTLVSDGARLRDAEIALRDLLRRIENTYDLPVPPSFYPDEFINLNEVDKLYERILGTKGTFYTDLLNTMSGGFQLDPTDPSGFAASTTANYSNMVKCLRKLYSEGWSAEITRPGGDSLGWQHRTFLKRGHQTLREYLSTHGFKQKLSVNISSEPSPTRFFQMAPEELAYSAPQVFDPSGLPTGFLWDDSVISRLVDPGASSQVGMLVPIPDVTNALKGVGRVSSEGDPLVFARRLQARDPSLCGEFRQQQIINYSRRHMGSRAYRGD